MGLPVLTAEDGRFPDYVVLPHSQSPTTNSDREITAVIQQLPTHMGWESASLTAVLRRSACSQSKPAHHSSHLPQKNISNTSCLNSKLAKGETISPLPSPSTVTVRVYAPLALAMLRTGQATTGRIWLLLRYLDTDGRGWVTVEQARNWLTDKTSIWRVCGWRQLRNLLRQGEGVFWHRGNGRLWLCAIPKVAAALGVTQLTGRPIALPVSVLTAGIGTVRAHFYATFHSSRTASQQTRHKPIARETIAAITHLPERTQRHYEHKAGVRTQRNFAIGKKVNSVSAHEIAWERGTAVFELKDFLGKHGQQGSTYWAWQLPNSYVGPHKQTGRGRQKRMNRELADLFMQGMTGNGRSAHTPPPPYTTRRYYANGRLAAKACTRRAANELYWTVPYKNGRLRLWYFLETK
ncbi:MAG: hypothetical protein D6706_09180 [Chloroflexi bacterium]|nr:MAG: hypothetical protein D6706_09180 [Chloroflexota bacterium]